MVRLLAFARGLLRRRAISEELDEELAFHLQEETDAHVVRGVPLEEARRLAALSLGGVGQTRDSVLDVRTTRLDIAWRETCQGIRTLRAAPAFTIPALIVLALGIGGTTAVFSVLDGVLFEPLPYPHPDRVVRVWSRNDERRIAFLSVSPADFEDWQQRASGLGQLAAYERAQVLPSGEAGAEPVEVMSATPGLFALLGASPAIGRTFTADDAPDSTVVMSFELWRQRFGGAADVIGRSLTIGERPWTIVGVMPAGFEVPNAPADLWVPLETGVTTESRFAHTLRVLGRMPAGGDVEAVRRDLDAVSAQLASERPAENEGWSVTVLPLFDAVVGPELRRSLWIIAGAVLFVLLMASSSVAGLLLARASGRQRELAVRAALGASRGSLIRLLLLECLALSAAAGVAGLLIASWGVALLQDVAASTLPRLQDVAPNGRVFLFAAVTTVVTAIAAGLLPAWRSTRSLHEMLRARGSHSEPASGRALHLLVVLEVGSAVLLVVGSALLVQTVLNLQRRQLGFDPSGLLSVSMAWSPAARPDDLAARTDAVLSRLSALPGVTAAASVSALPFSGQNSGNTFEIEGQSVPGEPLPDSDYRVASPAYFQVLGIPIREGRAFIESDDRDRDGVVIVSETAATRFWPGENPLGRRLTLGRSDWLTIVGVAGDARYGELEDPSERLRPMMYVPHRQMPSTPMTMVLRSRVEPGSLSVAVRRTLASDSRLAISRMETMAAMLREASVSQRFAMNLLSVFAATAVTLAVVGLYGMLAFLVGRRTREIGVRFALGAKPWDVVRMVVGRSLVLAVIGVTGGLLVSVGLSGVLGSVLFGVPANDPLTYGTVAVAFILLSIAVSAVPTLRALHIDPVRAIRSE